MLSLSILSLAGTNLVSQAQTLSPLEIVSGETTQTLEVSVIDSAVIDGVVQLAQNTVTDGGGALLNLTDETAIAILSANTSTALDLVFISPQGTITMIARNATPGSQNAIEFVGPTPLILQLPGDGARASGVNPGDTVSHVLLGDVDTRDE